jgi:hypothetical protein
MRTCPTCGSELDAGLMCHNCQQSGGRTASRPALFRTLGLAQSRVKIEEKARTLAFGRAGGDPGKTGPFRVRVASTVLHWPRSCACCCQKPGVTLPLTGKRWTGTRAAAVETPSWEVPYCARCAEHVRLYRQSLEHEHAAGRAGMGPFIAVEVGVGLLLAGVWLAVAGGQMSAAVATALTVAAVLGSGAVSVMVLARAARQRSAATDAADAEFDRSAAGMDDRCACPGEAIEYAGRDEAGHTFVLYSRSYAEAFAASNQGKMVV